MKITVIRPVGSTRLTVEIDERSDKEALAKALFFTEADECGLCHGVGIAWTQHKAKAESNQTFTYIVRVCRACKAESAAGDYQTGGMFWKPWTKPRYARRGSTEDPA
jgi:hypothetical protein